MAKQSKVLQDGEKYYQMRLDGMRNCEIAGKFGELPYVVASRIHAYRKANNLPVPPNGGKLFKKQKPKDKNWGSGWGRPLVEADEELRERTLKEAKRNEDGVLICPPRYCAGYGL